MDIAITKPKTCGPGPAAVERDDAAVRGPADATARRAREPCGTSCLHERDDGLLEEVEVAVGARAGRGPDAGDVLCRRGCGCCPRAPGWPGPSSPSARGRRRRCGPASRRGRTGRGRGSCSRRAGRAPGSGARRSRDRRSPGGTSTVTGRRRCPEPARRDHRSSACPPIRRWGSSPQAAKQAQHASRHRQRGAGTGRARCRPVEGIEDRNRSWPGRRRRGGGCRQAGGLLCAFATGTST